MQKTGMYMIGNAYRSAAQKTETCHVSLTQMYSYKTKPGYAKVNCGTLNVLKHLRNKKGARMRPLVIYLTINGKVVSKSNHRLSISR